MARIHQFTLDGTLETVRRKGAMPAYVYDETARKGANQNGHNYWELYIQEIATQMGSTVSPLSPIQIEDPDTLAGVGTLILGHQSGSRLSEKARATLEGWVRSGGILVGFAPRGLDAVFGIRTDSTLAQPTDNHTIAGYFEFRLHRLTREIHPFMYVEQRLFALSDIQLIGLRGAQELAHLYACDGTDLASPAITWHAYGEGFAGYFAFDVAKTVWLLHQGKPLPPLPEGEYALRTPHLQVLGPNSTKVAYADEMVHLVQNMLAQKGHPFIYQIPPHDGKIPDALLYYSGDEYTGPVELSLQASDFMAGNGLGYHINIASERHPMTEAELEHIQANGHEVSCYMWIRTDDGGSILNQRRLQAQSDRLYERFGFRPGSVLIGSTQWAGWAEPARWLAQAGATADNTFAGSKFGSTHPLLNGPFFGFGYGTGYPFFFYDDPAHGNERIDIVEQPIVCYELGHRASLTDEHTGERETETTAVEEVHAPIDRAVRYHLVMNVFYHPFYIVNYPFCRSAIQEIVRHIDHIGAHVLHLGNNQVAAWWHARSRFSIESIELDNGFIGFVSRCPWPAGMIVKLVVTGRHTQQVVCDDQAIHHVIKHEFGEDWLYMVLPTGTHRVSVGLAG